MAITQATQAAANMNLSNDSYVILIGTKNFTERYYRDQAGWVKVSARGRKFRMTAEQVLNHLLPALAGLKPNLTIKVEHHDDHYSPGAPAGAGTKASLPRSPGTPPCQWKYSHHLPESQKE